MKQAVAEEIVKIPAGSILGLDPDQERRRHRVIEKPGAALQELLAERTEEIPDDDRRSDYNPGGYRAVRASAQVTFKRGEVLYVEDDLPKFASRGLVLFSVDADEPPAADEIKVEQDEPEQDEAEQDEAEQADESDEDLEDELPPLESMTVKELKAELDQMGVDRKGVTKRDGLIALIEAAEAEDGDAEQ